MVYEHLFIRGNFYVLKIPIFICCDQVFLLRAAHDYGSYIDASRFYIILNNRNNYCIIEYRTGDRPTEPENTNVCCFGKT